MLDIPGLNSADRDHSSSVKDSARRDTDNDSILSDRDPLDPLTGISTKSVTSSDAGEDPLDILDHHSNHVTRGSTSLSYPNSEASPGGDAAARPLQKRTGERNSGLDNELLDIGEQTPKLSRGNFGGGGGSPSDNKNLIYGTKTGRIAGVPAAFAMRLWTVWPWSSLRRSVAGRKLPTACQPPRNPNRDWAQWGGSYDASTNNSWGPMRLFRII